VRGGQHRGALQGHQVLGFGDLVGQPAHPSAATRGRRAHRGGLRCGWRGSGCLRGQVALEVAEIELRKVVGTVGGDRHRGSAPSSGVRVPPIRLAVAGLPASWGVGGVVRAGIERVETGQLDLLDPASIDAFVARYLRPPAAHPRQQRRHMGGPGHARLRPVQDRQMSCFRRRVGPSLGRGRNPRLRRAPGHRPRDEPGPWMAGGDERISPEPGRWPTHSRAVSSRVSACASPSARSAAQGRRPRSPSAWSTTRSTGRHRAKPTTRDGHHPATPRLTPRWAFRPCLRRRAGRSPGCGTAPATACGARRRCFLR
jgi:hypothetical protein